MRKQALLIGLAATSLLLVSCNNAHSDASGEKLKASWRTLPLVTDGKVDPAWTHTGYGTFTVDGGALRTDCDARGLGLLVYGRRAKAAFGYGFLFGMGFLLPLLGVGAVLSATGAMLFIHNIWRTLDAVQASPGAASEGRTPIIPLTRNAR